jgi:hypothetical protein
MALLWITEASYLTDYKIEILFNTNERGIIDLEKHLEKKIFKPLENKDFFKNFKVNNWTIEWENGADFSPEFLYNNLMADNVSIAK